MLAPCAPWVVIVTPEVLSTPRLWRGAAAAERDPVQLQRELGGERAGDHVLAAGVVLEQLDRHLADSGAGTR
jgi:hypothetical protein